MIRSSIQTSLVALTCVLALTACSSDDDDPVASMPGSDPNAGEMNGDDTDGGSDPNPQTPTVDLATTPVFVTTTCDAAPAPLTTPSSAIATAPAPMLPDTLVEGRLSPDSTGNAEHFWSVDLEAGIYHLIVENRLSSGETSNIGLLVESTNAAGDAQERLILSNQIDHRIRDLETLTLTAPQTLRLKVTPLFGQEDYLMGIFRNGTPVASPRFSDCPLISPLAIDTTEALRLDTAGNAGVNEVWYQSDLDVADYTLSTSASVVSGDSTNIIYTVDTYSLFGQIEREERVIGTNDIGTQLDSTGTIQSADTESRWFRLRNSQQPIDLSMTLTRN